MTETTPPWQLTRYLTHKHGIAPAECEDALAACARSGAIAVADGATEAFAAREWARLLVRAWVLRPRAADAAAFVELLAELGRRAQRRWAARPLPWYADEKRLQGSHAAFAGLVFERAGAGLRWRAIALGDCCLFQLRGEALLAAMPLSEPAQFGFRPQLAPSRADAVAACARYVVTAEGAAAPGDRFLLLSDAAACWYLQARVDDAAMAARLVALLQQGNAGALDALIASQRQAGRMRNDDVAALLAVVRP